MGLPPTYTTLDGDVLDLSALTPDERAFLDTMHRRYLDGEPWLAFAEAVAGPGNPALQGGGRVTRAVEEHLLYRAVRDLADRLGIRQGELQAEPGDDVESDPLADSFIPVTEVAVRQGVTLKAVYKAIERGRLVASGGRPVMISVNSLARWSVNPVKQAAGVAGIRARRR